MNDPEHYLKAGNGAQYGTIGIWCPQTGATL